VTFNTDDVLLIPTAHLRFVLREVTALDMSKNSYAPTNVRVLQQWYEPHQRYAGIVPGEWRDIPLVTGDDEA
jgi:hypothetical protein